MRVHAEHDVVRLDLDQLRPLVEAAWQEWASFTFGPDGSVQDPDTGAALPVLRLVRGRHRQQGAVYDLRPEGTTAPTSVLLTGDDGHTLSGTVAGPFWRADGVLGPRPRATGRVDVGAALRAQHVPRLMIPLIGGREADGSVEIDLSALEHRGGLLRAQGRAQRARAELAVDVRPGRGVWHTRVSVALHGRGLLGRLALLIFGRQVRTQLHQALTEAWDDVDQEVASLRGSMTRLAADEQAAGGPQAWLHRELWRGLREDDGDGR